MIIRGISDGSEVVHGVKRPVGIQAEAYRCFLRTADGKRLYCDCAEWLVAWPAAHRLITLMSWSNWKDFEV